MPNGVVIVVAGDDKTGAVFDAVQAHLQKVKESGEETSKSFTSSMREMQESITLMRDAFVLDRVYDAFKEMVKSTVDFGMEIGHMAQQTGISAQTLSVLKYTADQTGISFETVSKGFKKMSTDIFEWEHGEKLAGEAFMDLGISLKDVQAKGQDMYGILAMVADKFKSMPDGPHKLAIAVELFGRAGQEMIPILNQGAQGLVRFKSEAQTMGIVLDESGVQRMEAMHRAGVELQGTLEGLGLAITSAIAPLVTPAASWMAHNFAAGLEAIGDAARDAWRQLQLLGLYQAGNFDAANQQKAAWAREDATKALAAHAAATADLNPQKGSSVTLPELPSTPGAGSEENPDTMGRRRELYRTFGEVGSPATLESAEQAIQALQAQGAKDDAELMAKLYPLADLQKEANAQTQSQIAQVFKSTAPTVVLGPQKSDTTAIEGEAEKFAHGIFDPLFNLGEKWNQQWKQIRANLLRDLGQSAESQLFGMLFGDPEGRGGKGWNGGSFRGDTSNPRTGMHGSAEGVVGGLLGLFHHKPADVTSNGGVGAGAGTHATVAASLAQTGKKAASGGGIQVTIVNNGPPVEVSDTSSGSNDSGESQWINIGLKQVSTNGPFIQALSGLLQHP